MSAADIFLGLLAIIFPPLAVWIKAGICSFDSLINILLCMLGYLPGLIHAWYIISLYPEPDCDYEPINDPERGDGTVTRFYIVRGPRPADSSHRSGASDTRTYGTQTQGQTQTQTQGQGQGQAPNVPNDTRPAQQAGGNANGEGSAPRPPPTYAEAVKGDYKIQTQD